MVLTGKVNLCHYKKLRISYNAGYCIICNPLANKRSPEENTTDNEIRQWESEHPTHAVDAVDALAATGLDENTRENASSLRNNQLIWQNSLLVQNVLWSMLTDYCHTSYAIRLSLQIVTVYIVYLSI